ncbi:MAG: CDP-alcohol phosphatidyltransferase family protein [Alphaproteobacteria bacterium]|nr:CDP-alcohol phosphatidyltransferase family protein [Alphaproteobacteria bacterium]
MLDARLRPLIDPLLDRVGRPLAASGINADAVTLFGFAVGLGAVPALATEAYLLALGLIVLNRLLDGIDGAVARATSPTDFGGFLDIVCDFVFYAAVPLGFALADPGNALAAVFLVASFMGTGASFLAYAALAAKRGLTTELRGAKTFYYLGGLTEGFETILCFVLMCLFPQAFPTLAWIFGAMCWITTASRVLAAREAFGRR